MTNSLIFFFSFFFSSFFFFEKINRFYTVNNFLSYFMLFFIWGHVLIALSFLLSVFFQLKKTALITGYAKRNETKRCGDKINTCVTFCSFSCCTLCAFLSHYLLSPPTSYFLVLGLALCCSTLVENLVGDIENVNTTSRWWISVVPPFVLYRYACLLFFVFCFLLV